MCTLHPGSQRLQLLLPDTSKHKWAFTVVQVGGNIPGLWAVKKQVQLHDPNPCGPQVNILLAQLEVKN